MTKYTIAAESGADIPPSLAAHYGIRIVPMHVTLGKDALADGGIPVEDVFRFFERTNELPKTSGCTPADFSTVFDEIHEEQPDATIIHLAYSSATTCSYESALIAARGREYVRHYDTKSASVGQAIIVASVAEFIEQNPHVDPDELDAAIRDRISRSQMAFMPDTLAYLHAGGRLSNLAFLSSQTLRIKPLIEILDGKLVATKRYRGSRRTTARKMIEGYLKVVPLEKSCLFLIYSPGLDPKVKHLAEECARGCGFQEVRWMQTGCVVSSHGGPGALGLAGFRECENSPSIMNQPKSGLSPFWNFIEESAG